MIISEHLSGIAIAYEQNGSLKNGRAKLNPASARLQGSLISFQKRQIADATEWLRTHSFAQPRPVIFVCTTSDRWDTTDVPISRFVHNLVNGYGCNNFVWVREFNKRGSPHYHFVADLPRVNPVRLSIYWSGLFGEKAKNCVRFGSKPDKNGRRKFFVNSRKMAWYLCKYLGKGFEPKFKNSWKVKRPAGRKFQISNQASTSSKPVRYEVNYHFTDNEGKTVLNAAGKMVPAPVYAIGRTYESETGEIFNKFNYSWKKAKDHNVWFGLHKNLEGRN